MKNPLKIEQIKSEFTVWQPSIDLSKSPTTLTCSYPHWFQSSTKEKKIINVTDLSLLIVYSHFDSIVDWDQSDSRAQGKRNPCWSSCDDNCTARWTLMRVRWHAIMCDAVFMFQRELCYNYRRRNMDPSRDIFFVLKLEKDLRYSSQVTTFLCVLVLYLRHKGRRVDFSLYRSYLIN